MITENFHFYINIFTRFNIRAGIIYNELYSTYDDQTFSFATVKR